MPKDQNESQSTGVSRSSSVPTTATAPPTKRSQPSHPSESPAKKQSKWSPSEDATIIELRQTGMKWEDISKRLPGRSAISCRLHYQNYLERRSEWDEDRKNKLARLYERFKPDMWSKIAEEMAIPWRAAEAMHWQLGEQEMARRAGVVPFSLSNVNPETPPKSRRSSGSSTKSKKEAASRQQGQLPSVAEITSAQGLTYPILDARPSLSQSSTELEGENPPETLNPKASGD
ncbi:MAG: hypothetical protein M1824_004681 [Vezdaea acicularis]|nr:MAG: hypothetical protein M1824_004681 [Vezdaea acicularis]